MQLQLPMPRNPTTAAIIHAARGPVCCLDGQNWDWALNGCVITNPSDANFDGCVQLEDLLDLLSVYGSCGTIEGESSNGLGESWLAQCAFTQTTSLLPKRIFL